MKLATPAHLRRQPAEQSGDPITGAASISSGAMHHALSRGDHLEASFRDSKALELSLAVLAEACAKADWQIRPIGLPPNLTSGRQWNMRIGGTALLKSDWEYDNLINPLRKTSRPLRGAFLSSFSRCALSGWVRCPSAGRLRSSLAPPRLLRAASLTDLGTGQPGTHSRGPACPGRRRRGALTGSSWRCGASRRRGARGTSP